MKKFQNIANKLNSALGILLIIIFWEIITKVELIPKFILPSPLDVLRAFLEDFNLIINHLFFTLIEAILGLSISIILGFLLAIIMDRFNFFYKMFYPVIIISQTIPIIAVAPLIVLWFGFGMFPKVMLVFLTCFFPITISIFSGFKNIDKDLIRLMNSMGSNYFKTLIYVKIPYSLKSFFSGLKIASSYALVGAVVSEWLGGERGIGVYMTRVKKAYAFDKMFSSIILISLLSLILVWFIKILERKVIYWNKN